MTLKLRQIVLVAEDKAETVKNYGSVLEVSPVHGSGYLGNYGLPAWGPMSDFGRKFFAKVGLENLIFAVGSDFIEIMFPTRPDSQVSGFMDRRGGDTGYMIILQVDDGEMDHYLALAKKERVRVVQDERIPTESEVKYHDVHFHPKDCGGALLSLAAPLPSGSADGPWFPAGDIWMEKPRSDIVTAIVAAEIRSPQHSDVARRWSRLLDVPLRFNDDIYHLPLDDGEIRFAPTK